MAIHKRLVQFATMQKTAQAFLKGINSPLAVIYLLTVLLLYSCKSSVEKVYPLKEGITESVYASGTIKSNNQYNVYATVNGIAEEVLVNEGDEVQKGKVIIKLRDINAVLNKENAALIADYNASRSNNDRLKELQINIDLAKAKMEEDALLQQRQQQLWNENIGTRNELEQRQLAYKSSLANYNAALLRKKQLEKDIIFQSDQSKKNLEIATTTKNDFEIKSSVKGKVYSVLIKKGEMVSPAAPVAIIGDAESFIIELQVDEYDINKIKAGQKVLLKLDSNKDKVLDAFVTKINPILNERSKSFTVEAAFINTNGILYPNLTCEANIIIEEKEKTITIPRSYLLEGDSVLLKNHQKRKVITGVKDYNKVEILHGLDTTDVIYKPAL